MFHSIEWVYNCLLSLLDLSLFDLIGRHVSIACPSCHDDKHLLCGGTLSSPSNRVNSYDPDDGQLLLLKTPVKTVLAFLTPSSHCLLTWKGVYVRMTKYSVYSYPLLKNPTLRVYTGKYDIGINIYLQQSILLMWNSQKLWRLLGNLEWQGMLKILDLVWKCFLFNCFIFVERASPASYGSSRLCQW